MAEQAAAIDSVTVGGRYLFQVGLFDFDNISGETDSNNRDIRNDVELWFDAEGQTRGGLTYGASAEIAIENDETDDDDIALDEAYLYIEGTFGRFELGNQDSAIDKMALFAPFVGTDLDLEGDWYEFLDDQVEPFAQVLESLDATKIYYVTPRIGGFQLGASWTPEGNSEGTQTVFVDPETDAPLTNPAVLDRGDVSDWIELGARFDARLDAILIKVFGGFSFAQSNVRGYEDLRGFQIGSHLVFGAFTFGGAYIDLGDSLQPSASGFDQTEWSVGVSWENGPLGLGLNYAQTDRIFDNGPTEQDTILGMINYKLARGLEIGSSIAYVDQDFLTLAGAVPPPVDSSEAYILMLQTKVQF